MTRLSSTVGLLAVACSVGTPDRVALSGGPGGGAGGTADSGGATASGSHDGDGDGEAGEAGEDADGDGPSDAPDDGPDDGPDDDAATHGVDDTDDGTTSDGDGDGDDDDGTDGTGSTGTDGGADEPPPAICPADGVVLQPRAFMWLAQPADGTVSKLDIETMAEEGRYIVTPDGTAQPKNAAISPSGDIAVYSQWGGGVTKIYTDPAKCGAGATSAGNGNVVAYPDACIAWHVDTDYAAPGGLVWAPDSTWDPETCWHTGEKLWVGGDGEVLLIDGDDGTILDTITLAGLSQADVVGLDLDSEGNLWVLTYGPGRIIFIDGDDSSQTAWSTYGGPHLAVDDYDYPWLCGSSLTRHNKTDGGSIGIGTGALAGCVMTGDGTMWVEGTWQREVDLASLDDVIHDHPSGCPWPDTLALADVDGEQTLWIWDNYALCRLADPDTMTWSTYVDVDGEMFSKESIGFAMMP